MIEQSKSATCYEILQVHPAAPLDLISAAYWQLVNRVQNQRRSNDSASLTLHWLTKAYQVLSDPASRAAYDAYIGFVPQPSIPHIPSRPGQVSWLRKLLPVRRSGNSEARVPRMDHYEVLRVDPRAERAIITAAYTVMRDYYFHLVRIDEAPPEILDFLEEAYVITSNPDRHQGYGAERQRPGPAASEQQPTLAPATPSLQETTAAREQQDTTTEQEEERPLLKVPPPRKPLILRIPAKIVRLGLAGPIAFGRLFRRLAHLLGIFVCGFAVTSLKAARAIVVAPGLLLRRLAHLLGIFVHSFAVAARKALRTIFVAPGRPLSQLASSVGRSRRGLLGAAGAPGILSLKGKRVAVRTERIVTDPLRRRRREARATSSIHVTKRDDSLGSEEEAFLKRLSSVPGLATSSDHEANIAAEAEPEACFVTEGSEDGTAFMLNGHPLILGSDQGCDIVLPGIASRQARVWYRERRFMIHALADRPAILINGEPIGWAILQGGEVLAIGPHRLRFILNSE